MRERIVGRLGAGLFAGFLACYVLLHFLTWPQWPRHASSYAHHDTYTVSGDWSILWNVGLGLLGTGALVLGLGLQGPKVKGVVAGRLLLVAAGLVSLMLIIFPTDRTQSTDFPTTIHGHLHDLGATAAVAILATAMYILCAAGRLDAYWQRVAGSSLLWPHVVTLLGASWLLLDRLHLPYGAGLVQRALLGFVVLWLLKASLRAIRVRDLLDPASRARRAAQDDA